MNRKIIYVFGPKRLSTQYFSNEQLKMENGGWLKIGQTSESDDAKDKWNSVLSRVIQETRTGIPEVCRLFDAFEYPDIGGNVDDRIRNLLTNDLYDLECSKELNQGIEKYEIKAGREFVYGATRSQVLSAIAKFERDLILENYGKKDFDQFMDLIGRNNSSVPPFEPVPENAANTASTTANSTSNVQNAWCDNLWANVIAKIKNKVSNINNPKGRSYIWFKSLKHKDFQYDCGYSTRYGITTVAITTYGGVDARDKMDDFIKGNGILSKIPNLKLKQGAKNMEKWTWVLSDTLEKQDEEIVDWFVSSILLFYNAFE